MGVSVTDLIVASTGLVMLQFANLYFILGHNRDSSLASIGGGAMIGVVMAKAIFSGL